MTVKFGTSGLRGLSTDLVGSVSALYSTAFARHMLESGALKPGSPVVVGRDFRPSSPEISSTIMAAMKRLGLVPIDCGTIPTPALALYGVTPPSGHDAKKDKARPGDVDFVSTLSYASE
ncbi:MAG: hypothetical protein ACK4P4_23055, partial [Allorhizobium sp.]